MEIKRLTPKQFRDLGYLQDVNRRYFHPLGMALEVIVEVDEDGNVVPDGKVEFGRVWDYRDDPEGMRFDREDWTREKVDVGRSLEIDADRKRIGRVRSLQLGFVIQPLPKVKDKEGA